jgi:hypothetical protein
VSLRAQESAAPAKPALHVIGPVTATDPTSQTITVKSDKDGQSYTFALTSTKTLLKVPPGAKDLKTAVRITPQDLQSGDRVDVRYAESDAAAPPIPARSVLLMSARELQQARQQEMAEWQNSTSGAVTAIDATTGVITIQSRSTGGPKPVTVQTSPTTVFTRFSTDNPAVPDKSSLADIHTGDQLRVVGDKQEDSIQAKKVYSGAFRSVPAAVVSIDADNNGLSVKDLRSKQTLHVSVTSETMIRKLPPMVATMLANRLNGSSGPAGAGPGGAGAQQPHPQTGGGYGQGGDHSGAGGPGGAGSRTGGDPAKMLERMPAVTLSELKPGDAVLVSVAQGKDESRSVASAVIAGVEPIFQSAPAGRQGQSFGGDWSLDMAMPAQ